MKFCLAFNGQGIQNSEILMEFIHSHTEYSELISATNVNIGEDIVSLLKNQELLHRVKHAQILAFFMNHCAYLLLREKYKLYPSIVIGHGLGHYNALVSSESITYENAIKIVKRRAELAEQIVEQSDGIGMLSISGEDIDINEISKLCDELSDEIRYVTISIINTQQDIVLSYYNYQVEEIIDYFADYHVSVIKDLVPYHSKAMLGVIPEFIDEINDIEFKDPIYPVISNVTGKPLNKTQIRNDLIQQLIGPINMYKCVQYPEKMGISILIEASFSRVLPKIVSRNHIMKAYNIIQDSDKFIHVVREKENEYTVCLEMLGQLLSIPDIDKYMDAEELRLFYDELKMHPDSSDKEYKGDPMLYKKYQSIMATKNEYINFNNQMIKII